MYWSDHNWWDIPNALYLPQTSHSLDHLQPTRMHASVSANNTASLITVNQYDRLFLTWLVTFCPVQQCSISQSYWYCKPVAINMYVLLTDMCGGEGDPISSSQRIKRKISSSQQKKKNAVIIESFLISSLKE